MKKLVFYLIAALMATSVIFVACERKVKGVSLDRTIANVLIGEVFQLVATVEPGNADMKNVGWRVDSTRIVTVEGGKVIPHNVGVATVTAFTLEGGYSASCRVTVSRVDLESLVLPETDKMFIDDTTKTMSVAYVPENVTYKDVKWYSGNTNVMTINTTSGKLAAKDTGTSIITVKWLNDTTKTAMCAVTVPYVKVGTITIADTAIHVGGGDLIPMPVLTPVHAYNKAKYTSSNSGICTVTSANTLYPRSPGIATITATVGEATTTFTVTVLPKAEKSRRR